MNHARGVYFFFCCDPHNLEPSVHIALISLLLLACILTLVRLDIIFRTLGFAYLAKRDILRYSSCRPTNSKFPYLFAARGDVCIFRSAIYLWLLSSPRLAIYRSRGMIPKTRQCQNEHCLVFYVLRFYCFLFLYQLMILVVGASISGGSIFDERSVVDAARSPVNCSRSSF